MSLPSRISSEWRLGRARRAFRLRVALVLAVLLALCAGLAALAAGQGPRVQAVRADPAALVAGPGVVELQFSRPVAEPDAAAATVEPAAPFELATTGSSVVVRFPRALDAGTRYTISLDGVRAAAGGPASRVEATVETPAWTLDRLVPGADGAPDEVVSSRVDGSGPEILYRGEGVREFARLDETVLVVSDLDRARSRLELHAVDGAGTQEFPLPAEGRLQGLGVVDTVVLVTLTSAEADPVPDFDLALLRADLAGDAILAPVTGLDGEPIAVLDWWPLPGTAEVILAARDGSVLRWSPLGEEPPLPVGQFAEVYGVSPDGSAVVAADAFGPVLLDLADGGTTRLPPTPLDGVEPYAGEIAVIEGTRRVAKIALPAADGGFTTHLVVDDGESPVLLELPGARDASIARFGVSPSGQYLVVVLDGSSPGERVTGPSLVVDLASLELVATLPGVAGGL